jgi:hypothetical protein
MANQERNLAVAPAAIEPKPAMSFVSHMKMLSIAIGFLRADGLRPANVQAMVTDMWAAPVAD